MFLLLLELFEEAREVRLWVLHQNRRGVVLKDLAVRQDKHSVTLDDRVESVGDRDHSAIRKLLLNERLNSLLRHNVNVRGSLVQNHHLVLPKNRSADTDQLSLTSAEVSASFRDLKVDALTLLFLLLTLTPDRIEIVGWLHTRNFSLILDVFLGLTTTGLLRLSQKQISETSLEHELLNRCIRMLPEWIEVEANGACEQGWILSDHGDLLPDLIDVDL